MSAAWHVRTSGSGPPVVLVHGSVTPGQLTWGSQQPLSERWTLIIPDRPGYGDSPDTDYEDFEVDAVGVADLLGDGAHLVGHSYGGVVALLAAALRPQAVWSLTVNEPPAFGLLTGDAAADNLVMRIEQLKQDGPEDNEAFLREFLSLVGSGANLPTPLPAPFERGAETLRHGRGPWEAKIPLDKLAAARFPKLVISGAHHPVFDAVCDVLEQRLNADREVLPGMGHNVQRMGPIYNSRLEDFLREHTPSA